MSRFIWGKIITADRRKFFSDCTISFKMTEICINEGFAISFRNNTGIAEDVGIDYTKEVLFSLSDNFFVLYCEKFMDSIYYPEDGEPTYDVLMNDLIKLQNFVSALFNNKLIKMIELYISFGEALINDYETQYATLNNLKEVIFNQYLESGWIPTVRIVITRD